MVLVAAAAVHAHHGSADYHVDREITVAGVVREWKWAQPHTWVYLDVKQPSGDTIAMRCEMVRVRRCNGRRPAAGRREH